MGEWDWCAQKDLRNVAKVFFLNWSMLQASISFELLTVYKYFFQRGQIFQVRQIFLVNHFLRTLKLCTYFNSGIILDLEDRRQSKPAAIFC